MPGSAQSTLRSRGIAVSGLRVGSDVHRALLGAEAALVGTDVHRDRVGLGVLAYALVGLDDASDALLGVLRVGLVGVRALIGRHARSALEEVRLLPREAPVQRLSGYLLRGGGPEVGRRHRLLGRH